ncbi:MAG TPA: magnesium transporter, partial [Devosia sp.]|nr:magnesium transporter [Devosia sp.]
MLRAYQHQTAKLVQVPIVGEVGPEALVWVDLLEPTPEESSLVERLLGIAIPTQAEMEEIELSARLYNEDGAEFMTMTALSRL